MTMRERRANYRMHRHGERSRNLLSRIERGNLQILLNYYNAVDRGDTETVLSLFASDARYQRGTERVITGASELRRFYENERIIEQGQHTLDMIMLSGTSTVVKGSLTGVLKNGQHVDRVVFEDRMVIEQGKIARRETIFPDREI